jgi:adenylosuccinate synthase
MRKIVLISGHLCTGKSELARSLQEEFGYHIVKSSDILKGIARERGDRDDRLSLQRLGDQMDQETDGKWLHEQVFNHCASLSSNVQVVIDNIRTHGQLTHFRASHYFDATHVHLYVADIKETERRWAARSMSALGEAPTYPDADLLKNEDDIKFFKGDADVRIETGRSDNQDTLVRVAARLGLYSPPDFRCVDVIVGGQYGSEGKGNIAAYLANEYDVLVRVGGPNAGHTVVSRSGEYTYHQLPSGCKDSNARILLGPGMTINVQKLLVEIKDCSLREDRLFIDPQAMIIEDEDLQAEKKIVNGIGSTGQGGGAAAARRITNRLVGEVRLARDVPELAPYVGVGPNYKGSTMQRLEEAYRAGQSILLEGTQGSGLSLYHGEYPYVTSRDTNVAGCLAEAGISPSRVRRILIVVRATPIRVGNPKEGGTSGNIKHETKFSVVAEAAELPAEELERYEITSTTGRDRRVGWFNWEQFRKTCALNAPTDIVLTFADYVSGINRNARRFDQLSPQTIMFIEELERIAHAPVSLISTRFPRGDKAMGDLRNIIDRRDWLGRKKQTA